MTSTPHKHLPPHFLYPVHLHGEVWLFLRAQFLPYLLSLSKFSLFDLIICYDYYHFFKAIIPRSIPVDTDFYWAFRLECLNTYQISLPTIPIGISNLTFDRKYWFTFKSFGFCFVLFFNFLVEDVLSATYFAQGGSLGFILDFPPLPLMILSS